MIVLAFDTSTEVLSVAVRRDEARCVAQEIAGDRRHAEALLPAVEALLERAGLGRADLEAVAVGCGPGAFTGTRVGVATAKGLAIGLDIPLIGVGSLRAIAERARASLEPGEERAVGAVIDAHRGEVYVARLRSAGASLGAPRHLEPDAALTYLLDGADAPLRLQGSGVRRYPEVFAEHAGPPELDAPCARVIADEAARRLAEGASDERLTLEPDYVRASDAIPQPGIAGAG